MFFFSLSTKGIDSNLEVQVAKWSNNFVLLREDFIFVTIDVIFSVLFIYLLAVLTPPFLQIANLPSFSRLIDPQRLNLLQIGRGWTPILLHLIPHLFKEIV